MHLRPPLLFRAVLLGICLAGGASLASGHAAPAAPLVVSNHFDPMRYFEGSTHSWGVIENRTGKPRSTFRATMQGVRDAGGLTITQDFIFDDGRKQQRVWHIKQIDAHRFDAISSDVIGIATGYTSGNTFHWEYTLQLKPGNALTRVRMRHEMYLMDDGSTMINRVVISKLGIIVGETTEYFQRGSEAPIARGSH